MNYCDESFLSRFDRAEQSLATANRLDEADELTRQANDFYIHRDYQSAERLYWRALAVKKEAVGPNHLAVAATLEDLAELYEIQDNLAESRRFYEFAVLVKERIFGSYHPEVLRSMKKLTRMYRRSEETHRCNVEQLTKMMAS